MRTIIRPLETFVEANLTAADPYHQSKAARPISSRVEVVHPIDPAKTLRDLGRTSF